MAQKGVDVLLTYHSNQTEAEKTVSAIIALGRVGLPDDVGGVVAFLCSDDAKWINGQRIELTGGMNL